MEGITILGAVIDEMCDKLSGGAVEAGGILGRDAADVITVFFFDQGQESCPCKYKPDVVRLNDCITAWEAQNIRFCGMVHNHFNGMCSLTPQDISYGKRILDCFDDLDELYLVLICGEEIKAYTLDHNGICKEADYRTRGGVENE